MDNALWLELEGADNVRDVGGLPGIASGRLLRSDNLQALTDTDVRHLVDEVGVRDIVDLRTHKEVRGEGPGPMTRCPEVTVHHLSLFPEDAQPDGSQLLPWQSGAQEGTDPLEERWGAAGHYVRYLLDRPESVVAALRTIAYSDGATIVHCAAGKDRTGTIVAIALDEVGVDRVAIVADYALSAERVQRIYTRIGQRETYAKEIDSKAGDWDRHKPRAETMDLFFTVADEELGGLHRWLREQGWTDEDAAALRAKLLD